MSAAAPSYVSDAELMARIGRSDARAFALLVERHRGSTMRLAYRILRDRAEAEDVVQEAFERVWRLAGEWRLRDGGTVFAWLARIVINRAIDRTRAKRPEPLESVELRAEAPNAEDEVAGRQLGARIARALEGLPERQRLAFSLCQIDRSSNADAAMTLGVSVGALELLLVRARKAMRRALADVMEEYR